MTKPNTCEFCGKSFVREATMYKHVCEPRRRALAKDEKHVVMAYYAFNRFHQLTLAAAKEKTYSEFSSSPYYNAFVKFGSFVHNIKPMYTDKFIDWVINRGVKLDHWCHESLYDQYVIELIKSESVETALERSVMRMQEWAEGTDFAWNTYFMNAPRNRILYDIRDGKISPWVILNSTGGKSYLSELADQEISTIASIIDPMFWKTRFIKQKSDVELVKTIVKQASI